MFMTSLPIKKYILSQSKSKEKDILPKNNFSRRITDMIEDGKNVEKLNKFWECISCYSRYPGSFDLCSYLNRVKTGSGVGFVEHRWLLVGKVYLGGIKCLKKILGK